MSGIDSSGNGQKLVMFGVFKSKQGQQEKISLRRIETGLVRHFVAHNDSLINIQGNRLTVASINSTRNDLKTFIPTSISLELK